jgi:hypothetical protein
MIKKMGINVEHGSTRQWYLFDMLLSFRDSELIELMLLKTIVYIILVKQLSSGTWFLENDIAICNAINWLRSVLN